MKTLFLGFLFSLVIYGIPSEENIKEKNIINESKLKNIPNSCGPSYAVLRRGSRGGCYYINKNGNKTYVSRICCD